MGEQMSEPGRPCAGAACQPGATEDLLSQLPHLLLRNLNQVTPGAHLC